MTADQTPPREWTGTGDQQRVDEPPDRLAELYTYAIKAETHLWIASIAHHVGDTALDQLNGDNDDPLLLDAETLLMEPAIGCYICEVTYEPRLRRRKCKGEPLRNMKRRPGP